MIENKKEQVIKVPDDAANDLQAILLNYEDLTFSKISIDPTSFNFF